MSADPNTAGHRAVDQQEAVGPPIDELMSAQDEFVDLDTAAWDAAEEWIADNPGARRCVPEDQLDDEYRRLPCRQPTESTGSCRCCWCATSR